MLFYMKSIGQEKKKKTVSVTLVDRSATYKIMEDQFYTMLAVLLVLKICFWAIYVCARSAESRTTVTRYILVEQQQSGQICAAKDPMHGAQGVASSPPPPYSEKQWRV